MAFCLTKDLTTIFLQKLKSGEIDPAKLSDMTSEERNAFFSDFLGKENALAVNSLFESKLLLKNQKMGMITWAKKIGGLKPTVRTDLISKINKLDKVLNPTEEKTFLHDLATTKLGIDITAEEAKNIFELSQKAMEVKAAIPGSGGGMAAVKLRNYLGELKLETNKMTLGKALRRPDKVIFGTLGLSKALKYSFDVSSLLHQGGFNFLTHPVDWTKSGAYALTKAVKQFGGGNVMNEIDAKIMSSPNYEKYVAMKLNINTMEDPLPSTLPEKIPLYGRFYKATEVGFEGFLHILRANRADAMLKNAIKHGIDINDKKQLESLGKVINSSTGRGHLGAFEKVGNEVNVAFASLRGLKGQFDTLTAHVLDPNMTGYAKRQAGADLIKAVGSIAAIMAALAIMIPGSIEWDSRSSDFGKIKIGNQRYDLPVSGQMALITLAVRILTQSTKSSTTGVVTGLNSGKFGGQTAMDVFNTFFQNRFSPMAGMWRDYMRGRDFNGDKFNLTKEVTNMILPLGAEGLIQLKNEPQSNLILGTIGNEIGLFSNTYSATVNWQNSTSTKIKSFQGKVDSATFNKANQDYNTQVQNRIEKLQKNKDFLGLPATDQQNIIRTMKTNVETNVLKKYHFHYKLKRNPNARLFKQLEK